MRNEVTAFVLKRNSLPCSKASSSSVFLSGLC
jgi:hypothetical protein